MIWLADRIPALMYADKMHIKKIIISSSSIKSKTFNPRRIIIRQPRKKWGERIGKSCRRDSILSVFACANSMNFQNALTFCQVRID
jgi:hypothetical protein